LFHDLSENETPSENDDEQIYTSFSVFRSFLYDDIKLRLKQEFEEKLTIEE
jgi:hypothetical protein